MFNRKTILTLAFTGLAGFATTNTASAVTNPGFESGFSLSGWTRVGSSTRESKFKGMTPTQGNRLVVMRSNRLSNPVFEQADKRAADVADLEAFLGLDLDAAIGETVFDGSAVKQTFDVAEDATLAFDWAFGHNSADDPPTLGNDRAFVIVDGIYMELQDLFGVVLTNDSNSNEWSHTDFSVGKLDLTAGTHTIAFGIANVGDNDGRSSLLLDNLVLAANPLAADPAEDDEVTIPDGEDDGQNDPPASSDPIPEPLTAGLTMLGLGALTFATRRRRPAND